MCSNHWNHVNDKQVFHAADVMFRHIYMSVCMTSCTYEPHTLYDTSVIHPTLLNVLQCASETEHDHDCGCFRSVDKVITELEYM